MALPILDGNQSATTLSSILTSGEHIPAHTVVSLGTQAITDMRGAVSGSVVSISNFPATQPVSIASVTVGNTVTIAGTVTAGNLPISPFAGVNAQLVNSESQCIGINVPFRVSSWNDDNIPISGVVTVSNIQTVTLGSPLINTTKYPAAFVGYDGVNGDWYGVPLSENGGCVIVGNSSGSVNANNPLPISGTVTARLGFYPTYANGGESLVIDLTAVRGHDSALWLQDGGGNVPISGTVTIGSALPAGTNRIGVVTIGAGTVTIGAGTAQIGSVTASISGTVPISISSVTVGNSVTIGSLPAISGTVTANTFALQGTAVTTSDFTSTTASTVLANYNATREVLTIFNEGAGNLHVCAGATCTTIAYQVRLSAGDYYEVPNHQTTITHSAVFATAGTARVTQVS